MSDDTPKPVGLGEINYGPATKAEKKETEEHKKNLEKQVGSNDSTTKSEVPEGKANVVVTYVSSTESRGYVSNVFEDGGTCTITYTKGSQKVTGSSEGIMDVNKTTCPTITVPVLSSGDWTAVLSYSSPKISGSSAPQTVKVQ